MVPIATRPCESITKAVLVELAVEVETRSKGVAPRERASRESRAEGVVEAPNPRFPALENKRAVEVAVPPVEVAMVRKGFPCGTPKGSVKERVAQGEVVPRPRRWLPASRLRKLALESVVAAL